jgi:hypothetical protein
MDIFCRRNSIGKGTYMPWQKLPVAVRLITHNSLVLISEEDRSSEAFVSAAVLALMLQVAL